MDKEFIPYEQALDMKELGFDEPCFAYYDVRGKRQTGVFNFTTIEGYKESKSVLLPTYSQAFRWFREKHKLYSYVEIRFVSYEYYFYGYIIINRPFRNEYLIYEEAELDCLKKLIEIVKNK